MPCQFRRTSATRPTLWTAFLFLLGGDTSCAEEVKVKASAGHTGLVLLTVIVQMGDLVLFFWQSALLLLLRLEPEAGEEDLQQLCSCRTCYLPFMQRFRDCRP